MALAGTSRRLTENKPEYMSDIEIQLFSISDLPKLELHIAFQHKAKFASDHVRAQRRSKVVYARLTAAWKVPIDGPAGSGPGAGSMESPKYSVAITEEVFKARKS